MRLHSTERVSPKNQTDVMQGIIRWDAEKSIWFFLMLIGGVLAISVTPSWGGCLRVAVSLSGHWMVGHFAHKGGHQGWTVEGLPVQGFNLPGLGLITFGENWHSNHHAFPHSARLGIEKGQLDPGFWFISSLAAVGLADRVRGPEDRPERDGLKRLQRDVVAELQTT